MRKNVLNISLIIAIGVIIFLLMKSCGQNEKLNAQQQILEKSDKQLKILKELTDSVAFYKEENNQKMIKITDLQNTEKKFVIQLTQKDSLIFALKNQHCTDRKTVIDTNWIERSITNIYTQRFVFNEAFEDWVKGYIRFTPTEEGPTDIDFSVEIPDKLNVNHKKDEQGNMYVEVTNTNPYIKVNAVRSYYKVNEKPAINKIKTPEKTNNNYFSVGPNISYGINHQGNLSPYIGVGIQWSLIKF